MENKSAQKSRRKYDASFKQEVIKMLSNGRSVPDVAGSLGIGENIIYRWRKQALEDSATAALAEPASTVSFSQHLELQKRVQELEMEREILKKALRIFSHPQ